jgi:hypothetical protein
MHLVSRPRPRVFGAFIPLLVIGLAGCGGDSGDSTDATPALEATIVDPDTGIEWQNINLPERLTYQEAVDYCSNLELDGKRGFELPNYDELRTLVRNCSRFETGGECQVSESCNSDACYSTHMGTCASCSGRAACYWPDWLMGVCENRVYWSTTRLYLPGIDDAYLVLTYDSVGLRYERSPARRHARCKR